jgi:hypothetical protein
MRRQHRKLLVAFGVAVMAAGCAASPRQRPLSTSPIAEGPESMAAVRKQLEGHWVLLSLTVSAADGRKSDVDATGTLDSDAFGTLAIQFRMSDDGQKSLASIGIVSPNPVISTTGRAVIDAQRKQITYAAEDFDKRAQSFDPELAAKRANPFALERIRYYVLGADGTLTLSTRHDNGKDASVSRWKKAS